MLMWVPLSFPLPFRIFGDPISHELTFAKCIACYDTLLIYFVFVLLLDPLKDFLNIKERYTTSLVWSWFLFNFCSYNLFFFAISFILKCPLALLLVFNSLSFLLSVFLWYDFVVLPHQFPSFHHHHHHHYCCGFNCLCFQQHPHIHMYRWVVICLCKKEFLLEIFAVYKASTWIF